MTNFPRLCAALLALLPLPVMAQPDLTGTIPIFVETFDQGLNRFDGQSGLWSTLPRRKRLRTNAARAVMMEKGLLPEDGAMPPLHVVTDNGLSLRTAALPEDLRPALQAYMEQTGQGKNSQAIDFVTAQISTQDTWSQTFGYFEIDAKIPRGKGRWPAFWLTFAGIGWPPEIDVFEAYGKGISTRTKKDDTFNVAGFFDDTDADGQKSQRIDYVNPHAPNPEGRTPNAKQRGKNMVYDFHHRVQAKKLGADIYGDFNTYAALWGPEEIIFYFGPDKDRLKEVFRMPTPEDLTNPMYIIANDQFTARGGWWPAEEKALDQVLDPENDYEIRRIEVRALQPDLVIDMEAKKDPNSAKNSIIRDTKGDDVIAPGEGFDLINLSAGADTIELSRGRDQKIISGFGADDTLVLEGYPFADTKDLMLRLTQVGSDVWLPSGADPGWPHTVVFRDSQITDFKADQFRVLWPAALDIWSADTRLSRTPLTDKDGDGKITGPDTGGRISDKEGPVHITGSGAPDEYLISNPQTRVTEAADGGLDTITTWGRIAVPEHVERAVARGPRSHVTAASAGIRLETRARGATLEGGPGNDLFVLTPDSQQTTIIITKGGGHDRIRGLQSDTKLRLPKGPRGAWQVAKTALGSRVTIAKDQSILIEAMSQNDLKTLLGLD